MSMRNALRVAFFWFLPPTQHPRRFSPRYLTRLAARPTSIDRGTFIDFVPVGTEAIGFDHRSPACLTSRPKAEFPIVQ